MNLSYIIEIDTRGFCDIIDITERVERVLAESGVRDGLLTVFVTGSTASVSTIEYETGAIEDLKAAIERLAPRDIPYRHDKRWGDGNGFAHVRAALMKPGLSIPVVDGSLTLGTWQQVILLDFDNRPRQRKLIIHVTGE